MGYSLGVDLGTTYTAAAIWRDGQTEVATLGSRSSSVPSVVLMRDAETVLTGEAAERRAATEPDRVAREFKRRVGDTTPIFLGGSPYSAEHLMSELLEWVVGEVSQREGGAPDRVAVSHPANWGAYKRELLDNAIRQANLGDAMTLSEPEAAAIHYASTERVDVGDTIAVYDLGGGTFDAAVLRKTETGWETLGAPEGIERLGGIDFDAAVFAHVQRSLGGALEELDEDDPTAMAAVGRLRQECTEAKEALSSDTDASIPVLLPNLQTQVRLTRGEFEDMVRPQIAMSLDAMHRALASAGVTPEDVKVVLLVGGSSRIPLVAQMVTADLGRPVNVDVHPKHAIALGAALAAAGEEERRGGAGAVGAGAAAAAAAAGATAAAAPAGAAVAGADETAELAGAGAAGGGGSAPTEPVYVGSGAGAGGEGTPPPRGRGGPPDDNAPQRRGLIIAAAALVALLLIGGGVVLAAGGGGGGGDTSTSTTSTTSTSTTTTTQPEVVTTRPRVTTTQPSTTTTAPTTTTTAASTTSTT